MVRLHRSDYAGIQPTARQLEHPGHVVTCCQRSHASSGNHFTLAAMADSLDEYLPKMYALLGGSSMYAKMYEEAMNTAIEVTMFRPMVPGNADILLSGNARRSAKASRALNRKESI